MKSSKVIHHPGRDGEQFSTVEDEIEQHTSDIAALDSAKVAKAGDTMTGTLTVPYLTVQAQGGPEGGEIQLAKPATGSSLAGNIIIDVNRNNWRVFENGGSFRGISVDLTGVSSGQAQLLHSSVQRTFSLTGMIEFPDNGTYMLWVNIPFSGTVVKTTTVCASGSCTATVIVSGVVSLTPNAVSTSWHAVSQNAGFSAGGYIQVTISSNASCQKMTLSIDYTRALSS